MTPSLRHRYLDLVEKSLLNRLYRDEAVLWNDSTQAHPFNPWARLLGRDWPSEALTMIGLLRLRHLRTLVDTLLQDGIPGDLMEAGVWRGGASIYLRALLQSAQIADRQVWVADSFSGYPHPHPRYPADEGDRQWEVMALAVSADKVRENFQHYGLLDEQVRFLEGWFEDTLPQAPVGRLALLRVDAQMYQSTSDCLTSLYERVSPGGYVVVDGYGTIDACRQAVDDFRRDHAVEAPLTSIDGCGVCWRKPALLEPLPVPPRLAPVAAAAVRPFWSVIIPAFNRLEYLGDCIRSVLAQDPGPQHMEILVVDDHSAIDLEPLVRMWGGERVGFRRNKFNLGTYRSLNGALEQVTGRWIHVLHDDDLVGPGFYACLQRAVQNLPAEVGVACCQCTNLHADGTSWSPLPLRSGAGIIPDWLEWISQKNPLNPPAVAVRREVFEAIGVYYGDLTCADWEFYLRSAVYYQWWYQPESMVRYRLHDDNVRYDNHRSGRSAASIRKTLERAVHYLPTESRDRMLRRARALHAQEILDASAAAFDAGDSDTAVTLSTEAFRLRPGAGGPRKEILSA